MDGITNLRDFLYYATGFLKYLPFLFVFGYISSYFRRDYK